MQPSPDLFRPFFSRQHLSQLAARADGRAVERRNQLAAILFVDVVGCTALAEELGRRGSVGAEQLSAIFDRLFSQINSEVTDAGGDIIVYAGDAVWAMWPVESPGANEAVAEVVCLATRTALSLQQKFSAGASAPRLPSEHPLRLRASVGAGPISCLEFGTTHDRSDFLVAGAGVSQAARMDQLARPGEVMLSQEAWQLVAGRCEGTAIDSGGARVRRVLSSALHSSVALPSGIPLEKIRRSLPSALVERMAAGLSAWLAEFRSLTVLFIGLPDFDVEAFDAWNPIIGQVMARAEQLGGDVYQLLLDEKGFTVVLAFGLPGRSHEDDAARGIHAALGIQSLLALAGRRCSIGVTTGLAFCGVRGDDHRRQYTIVGPMMNLAARLMQATRDEIRCDLRTAETVAASSELAFERLAPVSIRGRAEVMPVFRPTVGASESSPASRVARSEHSLIVGRAAELSELKGAVSALLEGGANRTLLLEGEAGIGKTILVAELLRWLRSRGARAFSGAGLEIEKATPYYAFRAVFRRILGLEGAGDDAGACRERCLEALSDQPELAGLAPLLGVVIPLDWPDNEVTSGLTAQGRADKTLELLLACIQSSSDPVPTVLVIEDAHWLDVGSWNLLLNVARRLPRLLLIVTARPFETRPPYAELASQASARTLRLAPLSASELVEVVRQELRVDSIPASVADVLSLRAAGNPFFATELTYALRDFGIIEIAGDRCVLGAEVTDPAKRFEELLALRGLPISLQAVTTSRMDRLPQEAQVVVKVASIIGHEFTMPMLEAVLPGADVRAPLAAVLAELIRLGLMVETTGTAGPAYALRHTITQEIAYGTVPFVQRRQLHRAVAEYLESQPITAQLWPVLAHHWRRAEEPRRAVLYLAKAGSEALRNYANEQGASFLQDALDLDAEFPDGNDAKKDALARRAHWELDLGRAFCNWCKYDSAREHLERGLGLLGHPVVRSSIGVIFALLWAVLTQVAARWRTSPAHANEQRERLLLGSRSYEGLAETYFNTGLNVRCTLAALVSLNLAERAGPSSELARGYASIGAILGFLPAPGLARRYCDRALGMADEIGDLAARAWVSVAAGVFEAGLGEWARARELFETTAALARQLGDRRRADDASQNLAAVHFLQGDVVSALRVGGELFESGEERSDAYMQAEGLRRRAYCLLLLGRYPEAAVAIDALWELRRDDAGRPPTHQHSDVHALRALLHLRRAQPAEAEEYANLADRIQSAAPPMFYDVLLDYSAVAEVYVTLREQRHLKNPGSVRRAVKRLGRLSRVFPVAEPAACLWSGLDARQRGATASAARDWERALMLAEKLAMPRYQALTCLYVGRHSPPGSRERNHHLARAEELFRELGDRYHLEQTHLWLGGSAATSRRAV